MKQIYDYIIVGAGTAGCALANRLSRESSNRVLLLEAGGRDKHPMIHVPLGFAFLMENPKVNWCYKTEPEPEMHNRQLGWPRGKVLGGSSSINGMVYIRGQDQDYDAWSENGCKGWAYKDVLPVFKRSEHNVNGESEFHGVNGPWWVDNISDKFEMADLWIQAAVEAGIPYNEDFNGASQEGAGYYQVNIRDGKRQNTAKTFLTLCEQRPNLELVTDALALNIIFEGDRAVGLRYRHKGEDINAQCSGEVILCGGTINSPQLLELSGVGNNQILDGLGIKTQHHLPGVGENLQDHLTVNTQRAMNGITTFFEEAKPLQLLKNLIKLQTAKKGLLIHPASQVGAFFKTDDDVDRPDAQIHFTPAAGEKDAKGNMKTVPGITATVCYLRPSSRGQVHIRSRDPEVHPSIRANYLTTEEDRQRTVKAVEKTREIFRQPALDRYRAEELLPGAESQSYDQVLDFCRKKGESVYHPVGTCKMGESDDAVVDNKLKVHGVQGLRIADASVMPTILSGNTAAACIMIAERCADFILSGD